MKKVLIGLVALLMIALPLVASDIEAKYSGPSGHGNMIWFCPTNGVTNLVMTPMGITVLRVPASSGIVWTNASLTITRQGVASVTNVAKEVGAVTATSVITKQVGAVTATAVLTKQIAWITNVYDLITNVYAVVTNGTIAVTVVGGDNVMTNATAAVTVIGGGAVVTNLVVGSAGVAAVTNVVLSNP